MSELRLLSIVLAVVSSGCAFGFATAAAADGCSTYYVPQVVNGVVVMVAHERCPGNETPANTLVTDTGPSDLNRDPICVATALSLGEDSGAYCDIPAKTDDATPGTITPALIAAAMKRIAIPPAVVSVQPPNGRTLVNFDTNFFTTTTSFDPPAFPLLGHTVAIHLEPAQYVWQWGDGQSRTTAEPGAAYPDLQVTHAYETKGTVSPRVDVVWHGTYTVDGGPVRDIPGTATIAGTPVDLQVVTATPTLVGYQ